MTYVEMLRETVGFCWIVLSTFVPALFSGRISGITNYSMSIFAIQALALPAAAGRNAEIRQKFLRHTIFAVTAKIKSGGEIDRS
jgi:hypothetical protein